MQMIVELLFGDAGVVAGAPVGRNYRR